MSRLPDVFESTALYEATFKATYALPNTNTRNIVLAYKIGTVINTAVDKLEDLAPAKYRQGIKKSRNLVWALLIQAMLNDSKLQSDQDDFGESLAKEKRFRERLQSLASSRIWPVLREVFALSQYQEKLQQEKYDFLRTKEVYKRCMDIGHSKWGWSRRPL
jgi:hypothetical protein